MADPVNLSGDIAQQAVEPVASAADGQSNTGRPIDDLIKADQYLAAKAARSLKRRGLLLTKLLPPVAGGECPGPAGGFAGGVA